MLGFHLAMSIGASHDVANFPGPPFLDLRLSIVVARSSHTFVLPLAPLRGWRIILLHASFAVGPRGCFAMPGGAADLSPRSPWGAARYRRQVCMGFPPRPLELCSCLAAAPLQLCANLPGPQVCSSWCMGGLALCLDSGGGGTAPHEEPVFGNIDAARSLRPSRPFVKSGLRHCLCSLQMADPGACISSGIVRRLGYGSFAGDRRGAPGALRRIASAPLAWGAFILPLLVGCIAPAGVGCCPPALGRLWGRSVPACVLVRFAPRQLDRQRFGAPGLASEGR